jgi:hypothetical protein
MAPATGALLQTAIAGPASVTLAALPIGQCTGAAHFRGGAEAQTSGFRLCCLSAVEEMYLLRLATLVHGLVHRPAHGRGGAWDLSTADPDPYYYKYFVREGRRTRV